MTGASEVEATAIVIRASWKSYEDQHLTTMLRSMPLLHVKVTTTYTRLDLWIFKSDAALA